jgi:L,D-peptidoglycan transpeptidase YkuD (ErfK/YbiS/YcfS/YnhG family)
VKAWNDNLLSAAHEGCGSAGFVHVSRSKTSGGCNGSLTSAGGLHGEA